MKNESIGEIKSEIFVDRKKILRNHAVLLFFLITGCFIVRYFIPHLEMEDSYVLIVGMHLFYFITVVIQQLLRPSHITLYGNGLEFKGLGFWKWDDFDVWLREDSHRCIVGDDFRFTLKCNGTSLPKTLRMARKISALAYSYDEKNDKVTLQFEFPWRSSNITVKEFYKCLTSYAPKEAKKRPVKKNDIKKEIFTFVAAIAVVAAAALLWERIERLAIWNYPTTEWWNIIQYICGVTVIVMSVAYFWGYIRDKIKPTYYGFVLSPAFFTILLSMLVLLLLPIFFGGGAVYTEVFGIQKSMTINASKKGFPTRSDGTRCLKSEDLTDFSFVELCIEKDVYTSLPDHFRMELHGKKSWFGFAVKAYNKL